jgi:hypothetical protein
MPLQMQSSYAQERMQEWGCAYESQASRVSQPFTDFADADLLAAKGSAESFVLNSST